MPILDISKIKRPEILEEIKLRNRLRDEASLLFFGKAENQKVDFPSLWNKVTEGNIRWLNGKSPQVLLTQEEMRFIANQHRFTVEYSSNFYQKQSDFIQKVKFEPIKADGVSAEWETNPGIDKDKVILYIHGGGYIMGSPNFTRMISARLGKVTNMNVLSIDYRLAPEHPYPQGLEDCITSYKWLLSSGIDPRKLIISGDSGGGYYTLLTLISLKDKGIPLPAGAIVFSPATDLSMTSKSFKKNAPTDPILADLGIYWWVDCYLAGADPFSPRVSPLYADLSRLPPILIQATTCEMLYDDARKFYKKAKKAGVNAFLQTWDDSLHEFQIYDLPESEEAFIKTRLFVKKLFENL